MDRTVRTKIAARVPAAATFDAVKLRDGRLTIDGLSGAITADVRHGGIRASRVRGRVRLETGFGDVTVESATLDEGGLLLRLRAFNGDVRLTFARIPVDARILALNSSTGRFSRTFRSRGGRASARASARRRWGKGSRSYQST